MNDCVKRVPPNRDSIDDNDNVTLLDMCCAKKLHDLSRARFTFFDFTLLVLNGISKRRQ